MILRDFLTLLCIGNSVVEVRSAYNDKLLCKNVWRGNHEDIMMREVRAFRPEIRATKDNARPIVFCYVDGLPELEQEMKIRRVKEDSHGQEAQAD